MESPFTEVHREPILSGHGAEQRSMERNYQSPARFRHAAVVVLPPRSISPDPSEYLRRSCVRLLFFFLSFPLLLSFLSFRLASVCLNAGSCAYVPDPPLRLHATLLRNNVCIYAYIYSTTYSKTISFNNNFFNVILILFQ